MHGITVHIAYAQMPLINAHADVAKLIARIQKVLSEGAQLWQVFSLSSLSWWGERIKYTNIPLVGHIRPVSKAKRHLNCVSAAVWWWPNIECWLCSFEIYQGIRNSTAKKPIALWFFRGGGGSAPPASSPSLSLDPRMSLRSKGVLASVPTHGFSLNFVY